MNVFYHKSRISTGQSLLKPGVKGVPWASLAACSDYRTMRSRNNSYDDRQVVVNANYLIKKALLHAKQGLIIQLGILCSA